MQRFTIMAECAFLSLTLFAVLLSSFTPESPPAPPETIAASRLAKAVVSAEETEVYIARKQQLQNALLAYFNNAIASGDIVGAGVSIIKGDSILISDGFGKRISNKNIPVDGQTVFRLGSLSKGFAGVLAAELKDEGKLAWNDKVIDYLPEFQLGDLSNTTQITLANILSHTSGTPYHSFTNLVEAGLPMATIAGRFGEVVPISKPGLLYSYQNAMFALCGEIMYKATGQNIATSLNKRFFNPLGMCSTSMDYETLEHTENVAMPHIKRRSGWRKIPLTDNYYNAIAAGGINASALDMAKWMRFLLGHNPEVLSKTALAEAFNPFIEITGNNKYYHRWPGHQRSYYGFGWRIHKYVEKNATVEKTIWHHGGSVNNYRNEIALYPEADLGICVLLNSNSRLAKTVIPDLHEIVNQIYKTPSSGTHTGNTVALKSF